MQHCILSQLEYRIEQLIWLCSAADVQSQQSALKNLHPNRSDSQEFGEIGMLLNGNGCEGFYFLTEHTYFLTHQKCTLLYI